MEHTVNCWRVIIRENLEALANCTVVNSEMTAHLINSSLISLLEDKELMCSSKSDQERGIMLYGTTARKWNDEGFENFKTILAKCSNTKALEILNKEDITRVSIPNSENFVHIMHANSNGSRHHPEERQTHKLYLLEELTLLIDSLRAEFVAKVNHLQYNILNEFTSELNNVEEVVRSEITAKFLNLKEDLHTQILDRINHMKEYSYSDLMPDIVQLKNQIRMQEIKLEGLSASTHKTSD